VLLAHHGLYSGDGLWVPGKDADVGSETAVTSLADGDRDGCPGVKVEADGGNWP
jgi:hypothetical protein